LELLDGDGVVWGDQNALIQAIKKLLISAVSVSPRRATIQTSISVSDHFVKIEVIDQGPAISQEERQSVFERLALPAHGRLGDKRIGLGLVIVKKIASLHGGQVGVAGELTGGNSLWMQLPEYVHDQEDEGEF
jgi:signal transduction histidine kinase